MKTVDNESQGVTQQNPYRHELYIFSFLFFMWGFLSCLNDLLVPYMRGIFDLSYAQAMMVQFSFFSAFFLFAIPIGFIVDKVGYKRGIVLGLSLASLGCIFFYPAAQSVSYPFFLFALFVLALGICCLQVSANPYVVLLGPEKTGSSRLNLVQGFNSLGTTVAPYFAALFIFSSMEKVTGADGLKLPYLSIALVLAILAFVFNRLKLPQTYSSEKNESTHEVTKKKPSVSLKEIIIILSSSRSLLFGALGIFFYVGVEVSIGSLLINFIAEPSIGNMSEAKASEYVTLFWAGAMVGRFFGAFLMYWIKPNVILMMCALTACVLVGTAVASSGQLAMWSILAVGLCNSIMFPTIFSLSIGKAGVFTSQASGILCLAIVGGAIIPIMQGLLADAVGLQLSLSLPIVGYLYIVFYSCYGFNAVDKKSRKKFRN